MDTIRHLDIYCFQFRYASAFDKVLLLIGSLVAIGTGIGLPMMSIIMAMCFLTVCENLVNQLRREFFKAILRQDITWFDKNHSGTLATKLFDNLERVKEGTGDKLGLMIQFVAQFFGGFIVAFSYDWKLTLIMMSLAPFMIICGAFIAKLMASAATREAKKYAVAGGIAEEVLTSMRTVIAFNGQPFECQRYDKALADGRSTGIKKSFYIGLGLALTFLIMFSSYCLAFWVGTDFVFKNQMQGGTVMTVFFSVMMGSMALGQAGPQFAVLGTAMGAAGSLYQIIDREPEIDAYSTEGVRPKNLKGKISISNLKFTYPTRPDVPILQGVSFEANPGETVALVGSSGCGKSTIIQLLLRYYNPLDGKITIDGVEIDKINIEFLRNYIGVVSQEPMLFNTTIEQNIRYGRENVTEGEITAALRKANAYNFVQSFPDVRIRLGIGFGIKTNVGDRGTQMSGGQKQRIAIARALVRDPKVLLLDEATSALDAESEHVVQQALENSRATIRALQASKGRTTIVIAHRLSTIRNADKIVAMKNGEVVEVGTHDELIARKGLYYELVNAQVFADVEDKSGDDLKRGSSISSRRSSTSSLHSRELKRLKSQLSHSDEVPDAIDQNDPKKAEKDLERLKKELAEEGAVKANLFKILRYARPEWPFLALAVFSKPPGDPSLRSDGHFWALMFLVLGGVEAVTMIVQCFFFGMSAERLTMRLRSKVFHNVMRMDATYFDMPRHSPGKITTRLATDAPNVKSAIDFRLGSVFNSVVSVCCGIGIAFYFGWQMALLTIAIFPLAGVGQAIQMKFMSGRATADAKEMENSGKIAMEAIENIRTVQALTLEHRLHAQFCRHLDGPHKTSRRRAVMQGISYGFASSIFYFLYASAFRFGLWLIIRGTLHPMNVLRVLFAISFTAGSMGFASAYFPEYIKATFAAGLIFNMLQEEPRIDGMTTNGKKPKLSGSVTLNNVYFKYPERPDVPILHGLDVSVKPGETLALVGPSGCGKSTVISLLERLYDPLDGVVAVDGHDLREMNPTHLRSHIALVSQEPILFDTSIRANIVYGLPPGSVTEAAIAEVAQKANIHKFISELPDGYDTRVGEKGTQLSGGQKQRIAIARALIRNPQILLLDEATSALDTESEKLVQEALDKASEGRTCIVVAHRLSTVVNANCIMVVKAGKVVEKGTHNELMQAKGAYWALTQKQNISTN
ncbi:multidrug resistance protein 1 domain protein [Ancylostoma ceylanicum]|uniref:Multidrug resistance protein 1 domain protein n=1 Tax=Ancylostoma ceylanicum TaxID=53326 RepID=A0A0D6LQ38_9BILA|nr:multidrug resistance protein 1 domain protein [Ancylostoma ceylanicum]